VSSHTHQSPSPSLEEPASAEACSGGHRLSLGPLRTVRDRLRKPDGLDRLWSVGVVYASLREVTRTWSLLTKVVQDTFVKHTLTLSTELVVHIMLSPVDTLPVISELFRTVNLHFLKELQTTTCHLLTFIDALPWILLLRITQHELLALVVAVLAEVVSTSAERCSTELYLRDG